MTLTAERFSRRPASALVLAGIAIAALTACGGPSAEPAPSEPAPVSEAPSETAEATPTEEAASLADTVWAAVLENFGGQVSSGSPLFAVTEVEDVSSGTIRVYVQESLTDAGRDEVAQHTFNMGAFDNDELQTVVVRDASGVDSNHYR